MVNVKAKMPALSPGAIPQPARRRAARASTGVPGPIRRALLSETWALPLDIFRVLAGLLVFFWFARTWLERELFTHPDGLIDHALTGDIFWFTRLGLFQPGTPTIVLDAALLAACALSLAIAVGWRPRLSALILFPIAVSTYRWNFLVLYVDDAFMHLVILWLILLPVGRTLTVAGWIRDGRDAWRKWAVEVVPGGAVVCFLANLALLYLVAGLWKYTSPMWQEGTALYAILRMPVSRAPDFWNPSHLPWLRAANDIAIFVEPLVPLVFFFPRGHLVRWLGALGAFAFHLGIILTLWIPFANFGLIAALSIVLRDEIAAFAQRRITPRPSRLSTRSRLLATERLAVGFVVVLTLAMLRRVPVAEALHQPAYALLWMGGVAQDYQLFNWVDRKNIHARCEIVEQIEGEPSREIPPSRFFPPGVRATLLQSYLCGVRWMEVPVERRLELRDSIRERLAARYCKLYHPKGRVVVRAWIQRVTSDNLALDRPFRFTLVAFRCEDGKPQIVGSHRYRTRARERSPPED